MKTFFLTTPIYYPNARPHVGSAYTTIVCDVIARYKRMCGYDVAFLTGTDEHGEKLARAAADAGKSPSDFVAEKRLLFIDLWKKLGIDVAVYPEAPPTGSDALRFIYTDHPDHVKSVQRLLVRARERGCIFTKRYEGRYCVSDERYVSDSTDPVDCDICGRPAELISEDNYFFKLSAFQDKLLELYDKHPEFVQPDYRRNEVISFVKSGLRDISISRRRLKWGIPWPDDPEQVFYVWFDALISYMTGIGFATAEKGSSEFQNYWRNKPGESALVHMIGKDILRFHAVYWPAFIMAAYPDQPEMLPTTIFAHGWIYYEQDKMSKSKGNVVYPEPIVEALNSFGAPGNDALRYYLLRETTFGQDTSFSYDALIQRYNSDLANDLGNLASRVITMINRYFGGTTPTSLTPVARVGPAPRTAVAKTAKQELTHCFDKFDFSNGLDVIRDFISETNSFLNDEKPWEIAEDPSQKAKLAAILKSAAEDLRFLAVLLHPVLPKSTERIWQALGCQATEGKLNEQRIDDLDWGASRPLRMVGKPEAIFPRLDKAKTLAKLHELAEALYRPAQGEADYRGTGVSPVHEHGQDAHATFVPQPKGATVPSEEQSSIVNQQSSIPSPQPPTPSPQISIDDFAKVDMRVGEILTAERIPNAQKLLKLTVDIGSEVRQVLAGIAEHYEPEKLIGMKVVLVVNLQPRKMRGLESNGMIVAASVGEGGKPVLVTFNEEVPKGARLK